MKHELLKAIQFATYKHRGQMRSGTDQPYIVHPLEVAQILYEHEHESPRLLQAAVLHDVLEDTSATVGELSCLFGASVIALVQEVTDDQSLTKKEQRAALMTKIPLMSMEARLLKAADGISNVRHTNTRQPAKWGRSLKLAYVKTREKVAIGCRGWWGMSAPLIFETHAREVEAAKSRLSKANYVEFTE